jgi:transposase
VSDEETQKIRRYYMNSPALCIDVSKSSSFATGFLSYNKPYSKSFEFSHTPEGMKSALLCIKELQINTVSKPDVVLEATGNFYKPVTQYFINLGYSVYVLNPLQTSIEKRKSIHKIKTDPVDTYRIAQVYYTKDLKPFKE